MRLKLHSAVLIPLFVMWSCLITGCATIGSSGTAKDTKLVIPDYPTAAEQLEFAQMYKGGMVVSPDVAKRKLQMQKTIQCYEKVLTNFPDDTVCCPRAVLEIGDCQVQSGDIAKGVHQYQIALDRYGNDPFIDARAQFSIARTLDMQHKYAEAKVIYKRIMDTYGESTSGAVRSIVGKAKKSYYTVMEKPKPKKKKA